MGEAEEAEERRELRVRVGVGAVAEGGEVSCALEPAKTAAEGMGENATVSRLGSAPSELRTEMRSGCR